MIVDRVSFLLKRWINITDRVEMRVFRVTRCIMQRDRYSKASRGQREQRHSLDESR